MQQDSAVAAVENILNVLFRNLGFTLQHHLMALKRYHLTRILIGKVLIPALQYTGGERTAYAVFEILTVDLHFLGEVENLKNVLISLISDGTEHRRHGQFFLTVDVSVHHVVDVRRELNPGTFERNDAGTVEHSTVGMYTLTEEHAG